MGSSASKTTRAAASTARKYPTRTPTTTPSTKLPSRSSPAASTQAPAPAPAAQSPIAEASAPPTGKHDSSTDKARTNEKQAETYAAADAPNDSALSARLRKLGPVTPSPTMSNSSTFNLSEGSLRSPNLPPLSKRPNGRGNRAADSHGGSARPREHDQSLSFSPSASSPEQSIFPTAGFAGMRGNPAVALLQAREKLQAAADKEFEELGKQSGREKGREFLDVATIRSVLVMIGEGRGEGEIEKALGLRKGVVGRLRGGVYGITGV